MKRGTLITIGLIVIVIVGAAALASALPMSKLGGLGSGNAISSATGTSGLPILANQMPDFAGITNWWNTPNNQPLTPAELKGKVVLVDFWTYSCINCIRTYPFLKSMYAKYADDGLVIVGVHTPEFAFESDPNNVEQAILQNGLKYPVALDANYGTWNAYGNEYWPAEYLFDREGRLRHTQFGEGDYDQSEEAIRSLLTENSNVTLAPMGAAVATPDLSNIQTDETYFGLERGSAFMGTPSTSGTTATFTANATVGQNQWTAGGSWQFDPEFVETEAANDIFRFNVQANVLHIVLDSADGKDKTLDVYVDGKKTGTVTVNMSKLYDIATFADGERHTVELRIHDAGVRFYAATFS